MRFIFKTDYAQDIRLARHGGHVFWYGVLLLVLLAAPKLFPEYWLAQLTFVLIYSIVGGLVVGIVESLSGFYLPEGFKDIAAYVVVLLMLMVKPNGLFGEALRKKV